MIREQRLNVDKNMTVKEIVQEEKKVMHDKFQQDVERLQTVNMKQLQTLDKQATKVQSKNEKLQRVLVEKEATLLDLQNQNAKLTTELKNQVQNNELLHAKLEAL